MTEEGGGRFTTKDRAIVEQASSLLSLLELLTEQYWG